MDIGVIDNHLYLAGGQQPSKDINDSAGTLLKITINDMTRVSFSDGTITTCRQMNEPRFGMATCLIHIPSSSIALSLQRGENRDVDDNKAVTDVFGDDNHSSSSSNSRTRAMWLTAGGVDEIMTTVYVHISQLRLAILHVSSNY